MIKKLVDVLVCYVSDSDVVGRLAKINNKLSISYNLLVNNLNNMFTNSTRGSAASASPPLEYPDVGGLGTSCIQLLSAKLDAYNLNFSNLAEDSRVVRGLRRGSSQLEMRHFAHFQVPLAQRGR